MSGATTQQPQDFGLGDTFMVSGWKVKVRGLTVSKDEDIRHLEPKVMALLVRLASSDGEVITRDELMEALWGNVVVGDESLTTAVIKLRKALDDDSRNPAIIETVPKVGYRLCGTVTAARSESRNEVLSETSGSRRSQPYPGLNSSAAGALNPAHVGVATAAVVVLSVILGLLWWQPWAPEIAPARTAEMAFPLPSKPSIAVLTFENLSQEAGKHYLSDAITENIITKLSRFSELFVVARNSTFTYKGEPVEVRQVAEELGVRYVLEGSLQREEDRLRVSVQLIDALAGTHVWAGSYDREVEDIFLIQDDITRTVVATVAHTVELRERSRATRQSPASLSAYEYYLRAEEVWREWTAEANQRALALFENALDLDPNLARGYVGLAGVYLNGYRWGYLDLPRKQALQRALAAARKAVELDPLDYTTHDRLAYIHMRSGSLSEADAGFEKALKINPNAERVLVNLAELRQYQGRYKESIELMRRAMRLNPLHLDYYHWVLADTLSILEQDKAALAEMDKMTSMPNERAYRSLAVIYVGLGREEDARSAVHEYLELDSGFTLTKYRDYLDTLPYQDQRVRENAIEALRKAGLPE